MIDVSKCKYYDELVYFPTNNGFEEIPNYCDEFKNHHCNENSDCYYKQLQQALEENEKLQEEIDKYRREMCNDCGERDDYDIPCKQIRDLDYGLCITITERDELQQKLEKIKEIANKTCKSGCRCIDKTDILQIIEGIK